VQDRCTICIERTIGHKQFWTHPMELVSDVGRVESRFSPFGDSVSVNARLEHGLHRTYHRHRNCFGRTRSDSYVMRLK
jgi:hypothetical protein